MTKWMLPPEAININVVRRLVGVKIVNIMRGTKWGNPYTVAYYGRERAIEKYEAYARENLWDCLEELDGALLGCSCKPLPCHGDILRKLFIEKFYPGYKEAVTTFRGYYKELSNMYDGGYMVYYNEIGFRSVEAAFQAAKSLDEDIQRSLRDVTPVEAKAMGKKIKLRPDWEEVKYSIMETLIWQKIIKSKHIGKLINNKVIIHENTWNDTFWGTCNGVGENKLGVIIMNTFNRYLECSGL